MRSSAGSDDVRVVSEPGRTVFLVSCVSKKLEATARAEELYRSIWFLKARAYVVARMLTGDRWFILSAEHHLVEPGSMVAPYEKTLLRMSKPERMDWGARVLSQLGEVLRRGDRIVILAGARYREFLEPGLLRAGFDVSVPLRGLGIGRQLEWLLAASTNGSESKMSRERDLMRFYSLMERLAVLRKGPRCLRVCEGRMDWPRRGVYFFFEPGEFRSDSGRGPRIVRVGTHAVSRGSKSTLWQRLSQHRGKRDGTGGNHRGSIFRSLVGSALAAREPQLVCASWGEGQSAPREVRCAEQALEARVSQHVGSMPFLWIRCDDEPSAESLRARIEWNSIALLSNAAASRVLDPASTDWLGRFCRSEDVRKSGLWNSRHIFDSYRPEFLDELERLVES